MGEKGALKSRYKELCKQQEGKGCSPSASCPYWLSKCWTPSKATSSLGENPSTLIYKKLLSLSPLLHPPACVDETCRKFMHQRALHLSEAYLELPEGGRADREVTEGLISLGNQAKKAAPRPDWPKLIHVCDQSGTRTRHNMWMHMLENCREKCASSGPHPNVIKGISPRSAFNWW